MAQHSNFDNDINELPWENIVSTIGKEFGCPNWKDMHPVIWKTMAKYIVDSKPGSYGLPIYFWDEDDFTWETVCQVMCLHHFGESYHPKFWAAKRWPGLSDEKLTEIFLDMESADSIAQKAIYIGRMTPEEYFDKHFGPVE